MNYYCIFDRELKDALPRCKLDRRRIEAAHLQYAVLQVASWYKFDINKLALHSDTDATLSDVVKYYHGAFMAYYASKLSKNNYGFPLHTQGS